MQHIIYKYINTLHFIRIKSLYLYNNVNSNIKYLDILRCTNIRVNGETVPFTQELRRQTLELVNQYGTGRDTLRCLTLGVIENPPHPSDMDLGDSTKFISYEQNITFVGVVGMLDPPRMEVRGALEKCRKAGIRVIMITGDNKNTAEAICKRIGIFDENENTYGKVKARRYSKRISSVVLLFYCLSEQFCEVYKSKVSLFSW